MHKHTFQVGGGIKFYIKPSNVDDEIKKKMQTPKAFHLIKDKTIHLPAYRLILFDEDMTKSVALEGLGGPMTRARTKRAKEAIQQVLAALIQKDLNLEGRKHNTVTFPIFGRTKSGSYLVEFLNVIFPLVLESLNSEICSSRSSRSLIFANSNLEKIEVKELENRIRNGNTITFTCQAFKHAVRQNTGLRIVYLHFRHTEDAFPKSYGVIRAKTYKIYSVNLSEFVLVYNS
ncbi:hypothetical protein CR513_57445, partial [Mucuna pruriens]